MLTTHSPQVISDSKDILTYMIDPQGLTLLPSQYGQDANTVLLDVMDTAVRNEQVQEQLDDLLDNIQDGELEQAQQAIDHLAQQLSLNHLELTKARFLLKKMELKRAKNN